MEEQEFLVPKIRKSCSDKMLCHLALISFIIDGFNPKNNVVIPFFTMNHITNRKSILFRFRGSAITLK